jgi:hypothetical protein
LDDAYLPEHLAGDFFTVSQSEIEQTLDVLFPGRAWLSFREIIEATGLTRSSLNAMARTGVLRTTRVPKLRRVLVSKRDFIRAFTTSEVA